MRTVYEGLMALAMDQAKKGSFGPIHISLPPDGFKELSDELNARRPPFFYVHAMDQQVTLNTPTGAMYVWRKNR